MHSHCRNPHHIEVFYIVMHIKMKVEKTIYAKVVTFGSYIQVQCSKGPVAVQV